MLKAVYISVWLLFPGVGFCGDVECYEEFRTRDELQCQKIKFAIYKHWTVRGITIKKLECE